MRFVVAAVVLLPLVLLVVSTVRGRTQVTSCCALPPERDGRIAAALREDAEADRRREAARTPPAEQGTTSERASA